MHAMGDRRRGGNRQPPDPRSLALGWLARRPLTEAEIRARLAAKGFGVDEVARTVEQLNTERLIDDAALAADFIVLRSRRLRLGKQRLIRELERRGVVSSIAERAYRQAVEAGDFDPRAILREAVSRRLERNPERTAAASRRVYNALLRAGFPAAELYAELKRQQVGTPAELAEHGYHDDESA